MKRYAEAVIGLLYAVITAFVVSEVFGLVLSKLPWIQWRG